MRNVKSNMMLGPDIILHGVMMRGRPNTRVVDGMVAVGIDIINIRSLELNTIINVSHRLAYAPRQPWS